MPFLHGFTKITTYYSVWIGFAGRDMKRRKRLHPVKLASVKKERNESMRTHGKDERPKGRGGKPELSSSFRKRPENGLVDPIPKTRQWCFILTPWKREGIRSHSHVWLRSYSVSETESAEHSRQPRGMRRIGWARTDQSLQLQLASSVRCGVDLIFLARIPAAACSDLAWSWPSLWAVAVPQRIYQQVASLDCAFLHPFSSLLFVPFSLFCWWCRSKCGWNQSFLAVAEQQLSASFHTTILLLPICHGVRTGTSSWTENVRNDRTFGW